MKRGVVYILEHTDGVHLKIGKTKHKALTRCDKINSATGLFGKWNVKWEHSAPNIDIAENVLHYLFRDHHLEREIYLTSLISTSRAVQEANRIIKEFFAINKTS